MDPNRVAVPPDLASNAASRAARLRLETIRRLTETPQGTRFEPQHAAATDAERRISNQDTGESDYNTQIHDLYANLQLYPKADQRSPESNDPFSNQYQIGQDLRMMLPQSMNSGQYVLPMTGQPSTSREQQSQFLLQQQQQMMIHPSLPMIRTRPNLSTLGGSLIRSATPTGRMSDAALRQKEMQLDSQNQLALQQSLEKQQQMMHPGLPMTQTQQNLSTLGGFGTRSTALTIGVSNVDSVVGVQQMNSMQHLQQMMDQTLQTTQKQHNLLALGGTVGMSSAASAMGLQQMNIMQQQLHQEQREYAVTHSDSVDLPDYLPDYICREHESLKITHVMELTEIIQKLDIVSTQVSQFQGDPFLKEMLRSNRDVRNRLLVLLSNLNDITESPQINLRDEHPQLFERLNIVVSLAGYAIQDAIHYLQQPQFQDHPLQPQLSDGNWGNTLPGQPQPQHQQLDNLLDDLRQEQESLKKTHVVELTEIAQKLDAVFAQMGLLQEDPFAKELPEEIMDSRDDLHYLLSVLTDSPGNNLIDKLPRFKEFRPIVVSRAVQVINNANYYLQQPQFQLHPQQPQVEMLSDSNRGSILPRQQQPQQQQLGPTTNQTGTFSRELPSSNANP